MNKTSVFSLLFALFFASTTILFWHESNETTRQKDLLLVMSKQRVGQLESSKNAAQNAADTASTALEESKRQNADLAKQLEASRTANTEISASNTARIAELQKQYDEAAARLTEAKRESEAAKTEADAARKDADDIAKSLSEERERIETLTVENARLREDTGAVALKKENADLKEELKRIRDTDPAKAQAQIEARDKTIAQRDKTIAERDETVANQNKRIAELEVQVKELNEKVEVLSQGTGGRGSRRGIADRHGI
jgi:uncharacterized protein (DUF3084 family)